jgi:hypothetical protein
MCDDDDNDQVKENSNDIVALGGGWTYMMSHTLQDMHNTLPI